MAAKLYLKISCFCLTGLTFLAYYEPVKKEKSLILQTTMVDMLLISLKEADQEWAAVEEWLAAKQRAEQSSELTKPSKLQLEMK